ncbi:MAG: Maf-like protein [Parcubacteria group bacterium Gr01-1014_18]|nr:MAG: Maf-like protein [Parcubacteria group bacterium Greene0416_36]TSC80959.1 MAG: Maf-like protein [Parcubacteria group bacterium Gr01-1014_18]TSC98698.1 MAG: Maf-like protein [Parcubacteria group bacterium Greene1014_20]TSD06450.1 MAG: Maf-like protein [Parcubacteria group bacterium Greene0714_2]
MDFEKIKRGLIKLFASNGAREPDSTPTEITCLTCFCENPNWICEIQDLLEEEKISLNAFCCSTKTSQDKFRFKIERNRLRLSKAGNCIKPSEILQSLVILDLTLKGKNMKIFICENITPENKMHEIKQKLQKDGQNTTNASAIAEAQNPLDLIKNDYTKQIENSDAVLVLNLESQSIPGFIDGFTFLQMGIAYNMNKRIYLMHPIPKMHYENTIQAMNPIILNGDITKINALDKSQ